MILSIILSRLSFHVFLGEDAVRNVQSEVTAAHCRLTCLTLTLSVVFSSILLLLAH